MIFRVIGFLLVLTIVLLGVGIYLPAEVKLQRETVVAAPPEAVFMRLNSLREFQTWSPWAAKDPDMTVVYTGPAAGAGAKMTWTSALNGPGTQEIKEATFPKSVLYRMELGGSDVVFAQITLTPVDGNSTKVEWSYQTDLGGNPLKRYAGLFYPSWVSADYDAGLARLKSAVDGGAPAVADASTGALDTSKLPPALEKALTDKESQPSPIPTPAQVAADPDVVVMESRPIVFVSTKAKADDQAAVSAALGNANNALIEYVMRHNLEVSGAPLAISEQHDPAGERKFDAAIPLSSVPAGLPEEGRVELGKTPGGRAMTMVHKGPYSTIDDTYAKLRAKIKDKGLKEGKYNWEEYVTDSSEVVEAELLTNVYIQVE
jgi:effector-binding domain-containing protein